MFQQYFLPDSTVVNEYGGNSEHPLPVKALRDILDDSRVFNGHKVWDQLSERAKRASVSTDFAGVDGAFLFSIFEPYFREDLKRPVSPDLLGFGREYRQAIHRLFPQNGVQLSMSRALMSLSGVLMARHIKIVGGKIQRVEYYVAVLGGKPASLSAVYIAE